MRDKDLYARIPGIRSPWQVTRAELSVSEGEVTVQVAQEAGTVLHAGSDRKRSQGLVWQSDGRATGSDRECIHATLEGIPGADEKIAFDRFHVARYPGEAVDKVRRRSTRR